MQFEFTNAIIGGALIGISVSIMMGMLGKITGISGILFRFVSDFSSEGAWRMTFLIGLIAGPAIMHHVFNLQFPVVPTENSLLIIVAGLIVGFGTKIGSGCTSGHGVCGIGRTSTRSMVATITFMATGIATVALTSMWGI